MSTAFRPDLEHNLRLERLRDEPDTFFNAEPMFNNPYSVSVYGGFVAAQALWAAFQTVPHDSVPRSLHCYFLNMVIKEPPVKYVVGRLSDGELFYTRDIKAYQNGVLVFCEIVQFVNEGDSDDVDEEIKPYPQGVKFKSFFDQYESFSRGCIGEGIIPETFMSMFKSQLDRFDQGPMEVRVSPDFWGAPPDHYSDRDNTHTSDFFLRNRSTVKDPRFHYVALTYSSDLFMITVAAQKSQKKTFFDIVMAASLDHSIYFHKRPHANRWRLHHIEQLQSGKGRFLVRGEFYDRESRELIATAVQEGIVAFAEVQKSKM